MGRPWRYWFFDRRRKRRRGSSYPAGTPQRRASDRATSYPHYRSAFARRHPIRDFFKRIVIYGGGFTAIVIIWFSLTLPDINDLNKFTKAPSILIKSEDGQIIGSFGDIYGDYVTFEELPASLVDAVMATEDRNFYNHFGIDPLGIARAMVANIRARHIVQGGSTITQQVAKNVFLTSERSLPRKIKEMLLAMKLERRFTKQEIMSIYLNRVYLGAGSYGVDAAAHRYFGKSARELTLSESAIMAGLLKAPSRFAPTSNPQLARQRAEQVLVNMGEAGFLTETQVVHAREDLTQSMSARTRTAQSTLYFADWIMDQLPEYIGNIQEDMVVTTTLKPNWQALAEKTITEVMDREGPEHDATQAALVSMTPDGAVRAMIGGRSYAQSQFNRATQSLRQPGSAFKLFVYLAALEGGFTPDTQLEDKPVTVRIVGGYWSPKNYTGKYLGVLTLKDAVTESVNTVAVQVAETVGLDHVIAMARRLGITSDLQEVPSIALGSTEVTLLELTNAYAHLAAEGDIVYPYGILKIDNTHGDTVYERQASDNGTVLRSDIVGKMNEMLMSVVQNGTGRAAQIGRPIAGKTGTTSDYRDAWFMGYTPNLVTGVWVGNDDNSEMKKVTGGMIPAMIWHDYMAMATAGMPVRDIPTSGFFLPWRVPRGTPEFPGQPGATQDSERKGEVKDDVKLGPSFWDKLTR